MERCGHTGEMRQRWRVPRGTLGRATARKATTMSLSLTVGEGVLDVAVVIVNEQGRGSGHGPESKGRHRVGAAVQTVGRLLRLPPRPPLRELLPRARYVRLLPARGWPLAAVRPRPAHGSAVVLPGPVRPPNDNALGALGAQKGRRPRVSPFKLQTAPTTNPEPQNRTWASVVP